MSVAGRYVRRHSTAPRPPPHDLTPPWRFLMSPWATETPCLANFDIFACFQALSVYSRWHTHLTHISNTFHAARHHTPVKSCQARLTQHAITLRVASVSISMYPERLTGQMHWHRNPSLLQLHTPYICHILLTSSYIHSALHVWHIFIIPRHP